MASLAETLGARENPTVDVAQNVTAGVQAGVQLATAAEQVEQKKVQVEAMKEELNQKKFQSFDSMMKTLNRASNPAIAKQLAKGMKNRFQQMGFDPAIVDITVSDPEFGRAYQNISDIYLGKLNGNPKALANALASTQDAGMFAEALTGLQGVLKREQDDKHLAVTERGQNMRSQAQIQALTGRSSTQSERIHNQNLAAIQKDPIINKQLVQIQNLNNALSNLKTGAPTPQSFEELQQSVRSNLGIKGQSTGGERERAYLTSAGLSAAEAIQFLTMDPQDITKYGGSKFIEHITSLADNEIKNVGGQAKKRIETLKSGHGRFYKDHADLAGDYDAFVNNQMGLFGDVNQVAGGDDPEIEAKLKTLPAGADVGKARQALIRAKQASAVK